VLVEDLRVAAPEARRYPNRRDFAGDWSWEPVTHVARGSVSGLLLPEWLTGSHSLQYASSEQLLVVSSGGQAFQVNAR
jgi:hypothetical protein